MDGIRAQVAGLPFRVGFAPLCDLNGAGLGFGEMAAIAVALPEIAEMRHRDSCQTLIVKVTEQGIFAFENLLGSRAA